MTTRKYPQGHKKDTAQTIVHPTLGFGVPATSNPHHFIVEIPRTNTSSVSIVENLGMQTHDLSQSLIVRVQLERPRWTAIRGEVQRAFNARLKERNLKTSAWKVGANPVDRLLGKELCVLAWAVEGMEFDTGRRSRSTATRPAPAHPTWPTTCRSRVEPTGERHTSAVNARCTSPRPTRRSSRRSNSGRSPTNG